MNSPRREETAAATAVTSAHEEQMEHLHDTAPRAARQDASRPASRSTADILDRFRGLRLVDDDVLSDDERAVVAEFTTARRGDGGRIVWLISEIDAEVWSD